MGGLTELVAVACNPPPAHGASASPEATITLHDIHAFTPHAVYKKSATPQNALAVSHTHVFAAQSDKAVLNVYNRTKGGLEAIVPLPEPLSAVACSPDGGIVIMGTTKGRVTIWETSSGRYSSAPLNHLQRISAIAVDRTATFVLTASDDATILVWSLPHLTAASGVSSQAVKPIRTLEHHQQPVVAVVCGKGRGPAAIAVSAGKDRSCIVWNYQEGTVLRSVSLGGMPMSLALDPADRAFYVGLTDGSVQQVEFARVGNRTVQIGAAAAAGATPGSGGDGERSFDSPLFRADERHIPITGAGSGSRWTAEGQNSPITAIDVVFEGNYVVTGTESGAVNLWDVATGHLFRTLTTYKAPISCVRILPPTGFADQASHTVLHTVVLPRYHDTVKAASGGAVAVDTAMPPLTLQFRSAIPTSSGSTDAFTDPFSAAADMEAIERGAAYFNSLPSADAGQPALDAGVGASANASASADAFVAFDEDEDEDEDGDANADKDGDGDEDEDEDAAQIAAEEAKDEMAESQRIRALEKELAAMKERYKRLSDVHKKTWEEHTKWVMQVDKEKAEEMRTAAKKGREADEMQMGE